MLYLDSVLSELPISLQDHHVALVKYSEEVEVEFLLDEYSVSTQMTSHVYKMNHIGGNTNTVKVLDWAKTYMSDYRYNLCFI